MIDLAHTGRAMKLRRLLYEALIVPTAHTRVFDADFQLEVYEVFHTRPVSRSIHLLCTPIVNTSLLAIATTLPFPIDGAILAALITLFMYVIVHGAWAFAMTPVLIVAVAAAYALAAALGTWTVLMGLAIAYTAAFVQTLSHAFEPIPPPWSGSYRWISLKEFVARTPPAKLAALTADILLVFPVLEFWASPRIWPVQMLHVMMRAGLRPALAKRTHGRVNAILADAREGWTLPPLDNVEADRS